MTLKRNLILVTLICGATSALVIKKYQNEIEHSKQLYIDDKKIKTEEVAHSIALRFKYFYQALRTISLVPGVRTIDRYGKEFHPDAKTTVQQIYNNAFGNVKMSEIYILPKSLDPEKLDPMTRKPEEPIVTFDEFIVADNKVNEEEKKEEPKLEEVEIYEYKLFKEQLNYFASKFPNKTSFSGIDVPAIMGKDVITCDNSEFTKADLDAGNNFPRMGLLYTVPVYGLDGNFRGGVSGILRTKLLQEMLPKNNFTLVQKQHGFVAEQEPSAWLQDSKSYFEQGRTNPNLIANFNMDLDIKDLGVWKLQSAFDNSEFWNSTDVNNSKSVRNLALGIIAILWAAISAFIVKSTKDKLSLENKVTERTLNLNTRNSDMRRILDNAEQGFLSFNLNGTLSNEHSAITETWFGSYASNTKIWDYIGGQNKDFGSSLEFAWDQVVADLLPLDLALDQLPQKLLINKLNLKISYIPIINSEQKLIQCLAVISDETAEIAKLNSDIANRERIFLFDCIIRDRSGFLEFVAETSTIFNELNSCSNTIVAKRLIHTIKGNCGIFGMQNIARICHELENEISESDFSKDSKLYAQLRYEWSKKMDEVKSIAKENGSKNIEIDEAEYCRVLELVQQNVSKNLLIGFIDSWKHEPISLKLQRLSSQASSVAEKLGKQVEFKIESNFLRMNTSNQSGFWNSLVHVMRNCIDHGIEAAEDRLARNKTPTALVTLKAYETSGALCVEICDDGRGVDWEKIRAKAKQNGIPCNTSQDLHNALFSDSISTKDQVTEFSGRGVGMSAVKSEIEKLGGSVIIESTTNKGAMFRFLVPVSHNDSLAIVA